MIKPFSMFRRLFRRGRKLRPEDRVSTKRSPKTPAPVKIVKRGLFPRGRMKVIFTVSMLGIPLGWGAHELKYHFSDKAQAVENMIERTVFCGGDPVDDKYKARLRSMLREAHTSTVEVLERAGIVVCLNRALSEKTKKLMAVYFAEPQMLVLRDDGTRQSVWKRLTKSYTDGRVPEAINSLPSAWRGFTTPYEAIYASAYGQPHPNRVDWWRPINDGKDIIHHGGPQVSRRELR